MIREPSHQHENIRKRKTMTCWTQSRNKGRLAFTLFGGVGELRALIKETVRILTRNGIQTFRFMLTCFTTELQRTRWWSRAFPTQICDKHPPYSIPHTVSVFICGWGATLTQTKSTLVLCVLTKPGKWILYFENLTGINYDFYPF